jgi:hypothetical protein
VLVLIDGLNAWDGVSDFVDRESGLPLPARRLAMVDALSAFQHVAPQLGASVFATCGHATMRALPQHLNLRKVRPLLLEPYSHRQLQHCLVHYHVSGVVLADVDDALTAKVKNLSGGIAKSVAKVAQAY